MEQEKQEALKECEVVVNTDPKNGPLDGASAKVNVARFIFNDDGQTFKHKVLEGNIKASYEIGTVSISVPEEKIMLAVRLDEIMQPCAIFDKDFCSSVSGTPLKIPLSPHLILPF